MMARHPSDAASEWRGRGPREAGGAPHTDVHRRTQRTLEVIQDVLVVGLALVLFALMVRTLAQLAGATLAPTLEVRSVVAEVLFMLVMVELVRLLLVYLRDHHVAVDVMVEFGIVSTLREVVLRGVVELSWEQVVALAAFLLALGLLLRFGDLRRSMPSSSDRADDDGHGVVPFGRRNGHGERLAQSVPLADQEATS